MLSRIYSNRGLILTGLCATATIWLAITNQLSLYIHPRYNLFTIALALLGLLAISVSFSLKITRSQPLHNRMVISVLIAVSVVCLAVLPPAVLSSNIATQRGVNTASTTESIAKLTQNNVYSPFGNQTLNLSIKEWSNLLAQTNDPAFFTGKKTTVDGFITKDESNSSSIFYASRFIVNCCAVDARPVGVPVYVSNWQEQLHPDQWVRVTGSFEVKDDRIVLVPEQTAVIEKPKDPYVY